MQDEFEMREGLHYTWQPVLRLTDAGADLVKAAGWKGLVTVYVMASGDGTRISMKVLKPGAADVLMVDQPKGKH